MTRDSSKARAANPNFEKDGGTWLELDVTDPSTESIVKKTVEEENVDVLVNSAAFALLGPIEKIRSAFHESCQADG